MRVKWKIIAAVIVAGIAALAITPFAMVCVIEKQRTGDATPAFEPIEHLGCDFFSQPVAFYRHCRYVVEFPAKSKLSDENIQELLCLNRLPRRNMLDVGIAAPISDRSIPTLKKLQVFDLLDVTETSITDEGIEELSAALPDCIVVKRGLPSKARN